MRERVNPEFTVLKHIWVALFFVLVWLQLPYAKSHVHVSPVCIWIAASIVGIVTYSRTILAMRKPSSRWLRLFPVFDIAVVSLAIRYTEGLQSDLWLFYYLQILAGALGAGGRSLRLMCPLIIIAYLAAVYPSIDGVHDYQIVVTRLFFLFIAGAMARYIASGRESVSRELIELNEQLTVAEERNRIARELHDGVGHSLVNSVLNIELCERLVEKDPAEAKRMLSEEKKELRAALDQVRDYVFHLRPAEIEGTDFVSLLRRYVSEFSERTGFNADIIVDSDKIDLSSAGKMVLLRIVQEALSNVAKHSMAEYVAVCLTRNPRGGAVCTISDNGVGFDLGDAVEQMSSKRNYGLQSMKERAEAVGGEVEIESAPGKGTTVAVIIPGAAGSGRPVARWSLLQNGVRSVMRSRRQRKIIRSGK